MHKYVRPRRQFLWKHTLETVKMLMMYLLENQGFEVFPDSPSASSFIGVGASRGLQGKPHSIRESKLEDVPTGRSNDSDQLIIPLVTTSSAIAWKRQSCLTA